MLFYLYIYLRVEHGGKLFLDVKEVTKRGPELRCKNRFAVIDYAVQKTVMLHHYVDNYFRKF